MTGKNSGRLATRTQVHVESLCFKVTVDRLIHLFLLAMPNGIIQIAVYTLLLPRLSVMVARDLHA